MGVKGESVSQETSQNQGRTVRLKTGLDNLDFEVLHEETGVEDSFAFTPELYIYRVRGEEEYFIQDYHRIMDPEEVENGERYMVGRRPGRFGAHDVERFATREEAFEYVIEDLMDAGDMEDFLV